MSSIIWIISSDHWPRALLRAELIERGFDAIGFLSIDDVIIELARSVRPMPQKIILDLKDQELTRPRLDALTRHSIPVAILGGSIELCNPLIAEFAWAKIFSRPFTIEDVSSWVES